MKKEVMEQNILAKLERNLNLTKAQVEYVTQNIEPKYDNDCGPCRFNVMSYLGIPTDVAFKILDPDIER